MSAVATLSRICDRSVTAPPTRALSEMFAGRNRWPEAIASPEAPLAISWFATRTDAAPAPPLSLRAALMATSTRTAAMTETTVATIITPVREPRPARRDDLPVMSMLMIPPLARQYGDAGVQSRGAAVGRSGIRIGHDVGDEVPDDEVGVVARRRLFVGGGTGIAEA